MNSFNLTLHTLPEASSELQVSYRLNSSNVGSIVAESTNNVSILTSTTPTAN
jgi:hypothetical protein